ncbi:MAG: DUF211 domain-containing protein [Candidatus Nanohaloarchaeota archaeon QJJ-9]|nr:DUF211 domain-containing protein [Candidatus Nanohaloarchaeota archaeon QJJ-9]
MSKIKRIVLDVLKPHEPSMIRMNQELSDLRDVESVNTTLYEVDEKVENIKITLVGKDIDYGQVKEKIEGLGGSVHSVDEVVSGKELIDNKKTPQDK